MPEVIALQTKDKSKNVLSPDLEASLIQRVKCKDSSAFQDLINLHGDSIHNLVGRLMAFDPEMEDVVQNTWIQVWRKIDSFRNESSLKTWISRIAILQTRNQQRSVPRWVRRIQDRWRTESTDGNAKSHRERNEDPRWELVQAAMKQLPYRDREILVLIYLQGHTVQELALNLNEKTNTLDVRLHRAKNKSRTSLQLTMVACSVVAATTLSTAWLTHLQRQDAWQKDARPSEIAVEKTQIDLDPDLLLKSIALRTLEIDARIEDLKFGREQQRLAACEIQDLNARLLHYKRVAFRNAIVLNQLP